MSSINCTDAMPRLSQDRNLPSAVTNIRLGSALRDCGALKVADTFDKSTKPMLFAYDDRSLGYTDWSDTEPEFRSKCFVVRNPDMLTVVLIPLDGGTVTGTNVIQGGVCDGMLLTEKAMSLVEFKTDVTSENHQTILQRANEAVGQLWHTFDGIIKPRCLRMSRDIEKHMSVDFHVVFDEDLKITGASSQFMDMQTQFLEDKGHMLYFENGKTFN